MKPTKGYYIALSIMTVALLYSGIFGFWKSITSPARAIQTMAEYPLIFLLWPAFVICYTVICIRHRKIYSRIALYLTPLLPILMILFDINKHFGQYTYGQYIIYIAYSLALFLAAIPWIKLIAGKRRKRT